MTKKLAETTPKDLAKPQEFKPTPAMRVWLDTAVKLMSDNLSEIERECQISRNNWYEWLKKPGFIEWWRSEWDKRLRAHGWRLDAMGLQRAKRDFKYWESMQKRVGNIADRDQPTQQAGQIVNIQNYIQQIEQRRGLRGGEANAQEAGEEAEKAG